MAEHVRAMLAFQEPAPTRSTTATTCAGHAKQAGVRERLRLRGFVPKYIRPLFCEGKGPFRWVALSGDPEGHRRHRPALILELFPHDADLRGGSSSPASA
jgi:urocanate hydratase